MLLIVPAPISNICRTREALVSVISERVKSGLTESMIEIEGNLISINIYDCVRLSGWKVICAVTTRYSSANIHENSNN